MNAILVRDTIINLDAVATVKFQENDPSVHHDDRCSVTFAHDQGSPLEIYGEDAKDIYHQIAKAMGVEIPG